MKGAVLAVLCAAALTQGASVVNENGCPQDPRIEKLLPHPNCNYYFQCVHGQKLEKSCPLGLHFSPISHVCDFPIAAKCEGEHIILPANPILNIDPDENSTINGYADPSQAPAICAAENSSGILVAHEICNRFYKCTYGLPVAIRCPGILLYDPSIERCEWPKLVDCGNRELLGDDDENNGEDWTGNGAGNDDPSQAPAICAQEGSDHVHVAHENCNQYYQCWAGVPVALYCPAGFLFDPSKDYCDWPYEVDCGNRGISENDGSGAGNDNQGGNNEEEKIPVGNNHNDPSQASDICKRADSEGVLVAHENCNKFYKCNFGLPVAQICPAGLLFDPSRDRCEWPAIVTCGNRIIPEENENDNIGTEWTGNGAGNDDPSQAVGICAAEGSNHIHVAHENCNQFYQCWAGKPVPLNCPPGFLFNPYKDYCDWPYNVDCGNRLIPDNPDNDIGNGNQSGGNDGNTEEEIPVGNNHDDPSQANAICKLADSEGVLVAHENCNKFYKCNFGLPVAQICPAGLLFDPSRDRCEWPAIVTCGNRIIPEENENDNIGTEWTGNGAGNDDPSQAVGICAAEGSNHIHVAHENCNQFYQCWAGKPVPLNCPPGFLFNPYKDYCDWPYNVDCGNRLIPENPDNNNGNGNQSGGNDGNTEEEIPVGNNHDDPSQANVICKSQNSQSILIAHKNCNQFYICNFGVPVVQTCPGNLLFDPSRDRCEWRNTVKCGDRVIPDEIEIKKQRKVGVAGNDDSSKAADGGQLRDTIKASEEVIPIGNNYDDPSQAGIICKADDSNGVLVAHENCNQYYICNFGIPVVQTCFGNLLFDPTRDRCEWRDIVKCGNRLIPDEKEIDNGPNVGGAGNNDPSQAKDICAAEGSDNVHVAHENCNQYYQCWAGLPVALKCPEGFYFNAELDYCDFAENVACGKIIH